MSLSRAQFFVVGQRGLFCEVTKSDDNVIMRGEGSSSLRKEHGIRSLHSIIADVKLLVGNIVKN